MIDAPYEICRFGAIDAPSKDVISSTDALGTFQTIFGWQTTKRILWNLIRAKFAPSFLGAVSCLERPFAVEARAQYIFSGGCLRLWR